MTIGEKIKEARKKANLSQKALGDKLGVSQQMITQYETGKSEIKPDTALKIAKALNISVEELLGLDNTKYEIYKKNLKSISYFLNRETDFKNITNLYDIWVRDTEYQEMFWKIVESLGLLNKNGFEKVSDFANDMQKIDEYRIGYTPIIHTDDE